MTTIRVAEPTDLDAIRYVHLDAFGDEGESIAELALNLIQDESAHPILSLVAEADGEVLGNVIFTAVYVEGDKPLTGYILAPVAVLKAHHNTGIGKQLIETGLTMLREQGTTAIFVLGDPHYYNRFGFKAGHHVRPPYELEYPEGWMALALADTPIEAMDGELVCANSLMGPEHWEIYS